MKVYLVTTGGGNTVDGNSPSTWRIVKKDSPEAALVWAASRIERVREILESPETVRTEWEEYPLWGNISHRVLNIRTTHEEPYYIFVEIRELELEE